MFSAILIKVLLQFYFATCAISLSIHGRYTRDIKEYQLAVPHKLNYRGNFLTFHIQNYFTHNFGLRKRKRDITAEDALHYGIVFNDKIHHLELWPNHGFLSPSAVFEIREPRTPIKDRLLRNVHSKRLCHYTGRIRDVKGSKVAVSTCDGLAGYIQTNSHRYYIEPVLEHVPNEDGQLLHAIYKKNDNEAHLGSCGTTNNWIDSWRERFFEEYMNNEKVNVTTRGLESVQRYLEVLVVADKSFLTHHKGTDYETYILTIMNMVFDFYHDYSVGNQMDVVVVRIVYLEKEEEEIDLLITRDAEKTLDSFCKWQQTINPKDLKNPNHHDIAVLLTRHDICSDNMTDCGLMGLAFVGTACSGNKPCCINEDSGLMLGIIVTHEMGHIMGCAHDTVEISGCESSGDDGSYFIMAPFAHLFTTQWSTCSRTFITNLFDNNLGECLNDEPQVNVLPADHMLPGAMYGADEQCKMMYPATMTACKVNEEKFCKSLLCKDTPTTCISNGEPPADGTKCGENKWCFRKKCIETGSRPEAVNGGWGEWGKFSECSRTCGGGVSIAERECNNPAPKNKGRYCTGQRKKIKICNVKPCPPGTPSFRALQCKEQDSKEWQGKKYTWKPYLKEDEICQLYCLNEELVFSKFGKVAKDGTKCKVGTKDMCIAGTCMKVGCDYVINSDAIEDVCGVCKGDGTRCKFVEKTYDDKPGHGYVKVATFLKGYKRVQVEELAPSPNMISISGEDEKTFYLNGQNTEMQEGSHVLGTTEAVYVRPEPDKEKLIIEGPLNEILILYVVFFKPVNVGYKYHYAEALANAAYEAKYHWEYTGWKDCSARCGGGIELSEPDCIEEQSGKVSPSFCEANEKPEIKSRKCNELPCKTKWKVGAWSECMACKHQSGVRIREVECVREAQIPGEDDTLIEDSQCTETRPGSKELCQSREKCETRARRNIDGIPEKMLRDVWFQTKSELLKNLTFTNMKSNSRPTRLTQKDLKFKRNHDNMKCKDGKSAHKKLETGTFIQDKYPPEEIKLIQIPLKKSHLSLNISDEAYESMGDKIGDEFDVKDEKVMSGKEAEIKLKQLQSQNQTQNVT